MIAEVLFPVALDETFYYEIPENLVGKIKPGIRIYASLARRKKAVGYVINVFEKKEGEVFDFKLKTIDKIIDESPPFVVEKFIELSSFISLRWVSKRGMVLRDFLRYLPLRLEIKNSSTHSERRVIRRFIVNDNPAEKLFSFIKENYSKFPIVVFFPNIFVLHLFKKRLEGEGFDVMVYTSNEKVSYRKRIIQMVLNNDFKLILSTKGGVHLPFKDFLTICIVEPLNSLYKQFEQHPYYDTVEVLMKISEIYNLDVNIFSSFISPYFLDLEEKGFLTVYYENLPKGFKPEILDLKRASPLCEDFISEVEEIIKHNKKVMFISYSKYSSSITFCPSCKDIKRCQQCGYVMRTEIIDFKKLYVCPYCNYREEYINFCQKCKVTMVSKGYGSQKFYEELINLFPQRKILLIDGRIIHVPERFKYVVNLLERDDFDIICATDIAATSILNKKFSLIVFVAYESQHTYDYSYPERAVEKIYNLRSLLQQDGILKIYTYNPDSFIFSTLDNPLYFLKNEIELRKRFNYPPYGYLYDVEIYHKDKDFLKDKVKRLIEIISDENFKLDYDIISYEPSLRINKVRGKSLYRHFSSVKLKSYYKFFGFLNNYVCENKLKLDVIAR